MRDHLIDYELSFKSGCPATPAMTYKQLGPRAKNGCKIAPYLHTTLLSNSRVSDQFEGTNKRHMVDYNETRCTYRLEQPQDCHASRIILQASAHISEGLAHEIGVPFQTCRNHKQRCIHSVPHRVEIHVLAIIQRPFQCIQQIAPATWGVWCLPSSESSMIGSMATRGQVGRPCFRGAFSGELANLLT